MKPICGVIVAALACELCGCAPSMRIERGAAGFASGALCGQFQAFDGRSGRAMSFSEVVRACAAADAVFFGEMHSDVVCNELEAELLRALINGTRPQALAMEFFETDTQAALEAYLSGRLDEEEFRKQARQGRGYLLAHRPLIEMCRAARAPVIAANAPRRLVRQFRSSGLAFEQFRDSISAEDRRWLPLRSEHVDGPYFDRFIEVAKHHPPIPGSPASSPASAAASQTAKPASAQPTRDELRRSFRPQLLWDDSMAESMARFRDLYPGYRAMLVVGRFHVAHEGGTVLKFRARRPDDQICTVVYSGTSSGRFRVSPDDLGAADVVLCGISPPEEESESAASRPVAAPASAPARR